MKPSNFSKTQSGASLIEVLVAVLILSIGLLAMGAMMSYATLLPKFSGNRSIAINIATDMIERMRANPSTPSYATSTFTATRPTTTNLPSGLCSFPSCIPTTIATRDIAEVQQQLNQQLPPAGITIAFTDTASTEGNLWIIWQEASTFSGFNTSTSDNCPSLSGNPTPAPRCVYLPFKL